MKCFIDTQRTNIDKNELRQMLKAYFDAGFKMAVACMEAEKNEQYNLQRIKDKFKSNGYSRTSKSD